MKKILTIYFLILVISNAVLAQTDKSARISQTNDDTKKKLLEDYLERAEANGFSGQVLIAEDGKILLDRAFGFADREKKIRNSADTVFNVASFTKQFTAAAILRLEADGKLKTEDPIGKYFENAPADKANITIHQLLTHTSGLPRGGDGRKFPAVRDELVAKIFETPLAAQTGEKFIYSNYGYHLLAAIIEKTSGQTYQQFLTEKLFRPAGMSRSGFSYDEKWLKTPVAQTYNEWTKLPAFTEWGTAWNYGSGSVVSTSGELYQWFTALTGYKILPAAETEKLFKAYTESSDEGIFYGYGWFSQKLKNGQTLIYHGGDTPGYHSEIRWYRDDRRLIVILANYETLEPDGVAIQKRVIANNLNRILTGEEYKQPPAALKLSAKALKKYEGEYLFPNDQKVKIWSNGAYLNIGAQGQEVINAIAGYEGETAQKYSAANEMTGFILENISRNQPENIKTRMSKADYDFYIPFLIKQFDEFKQQYGELKAFKIQGTTAFPWDPDSYRTNVLLDFEKGSSDLFLGFENGRLNDVTTGTGRPFPLIMPFVPNSKTEFSTFEFLRSKLTRMSFPNKNRLEIKKENGNLTGQK